MSNQLVLRGDMIRTVADLMQISDMLVKSGMLPSSIKSKEAAAAIIIKGREIGMPMMESFSLINVIQGKPTIAPQGMIALARRTRELENFRLWSNDTNTESYCTVKRKGQDPYMSTFTDKDAETMGLLGKDNWRKQKKVMREWRAVSANFRITFPDVIGGMYTPEEFDAPVNEDGEILDAQPVPLQDLTATVPNSHTVTAAATSRGPEWEELGEDVIVKNDAPKPAPVENKLTPGVFVPSKALESLRNIEKRLQGKAWEPDSLKGYKQQIVFALKQTAIGDDEEMRHALRQELFGDNPSVGQFHALKDWLASEDAKNYIADFVRRYQDARQPVTA